MQFRKIEGKRCKRKVDWSPVFDDKENIVCLSVKE